MVKALIKKEIKRMLKDRGTFVWIFIIPIVFIVIFATIFNNQNYTFKVYYQDLDHSTMSGAFVKAMENVKGFKLFKETDKQKAIKDIRNGDISTFIVIPKGFEEKIKAGKQTQIDFYYAGSQDAQQEVEPVKTVVNSVVQSYKDNKIKSYVIQTTNGNKNLEQAILSPPVTIDAKEQLVKKVNAVTQFVPGYTVMFAFYTIISLARTLMREREGGMLSRLLSTPMNRLQYLIGIWIPNFLLVCVQILVLFTFGHLVYGLEIGNAPALIVLSLSLALTTTAIGLLITFLFKNEQMVMACTQILALAGAALGGLWFPINLLPGFLQKAAKVFPQYWAQKGYLDILLHGGQLAEIGWSVGILLTIAVIGLCGAMLSYKNFLKGATH
ncbi:MULTISPECIES: ABC transporter permease [unclassified Thermoactinomyces]|jgi:ABC-2 type transport system permease protein|uniref:ABC transporter permease n=1 Tax=unclassified Thermoactinomyces TaxID=2634588 RepID=UPI0018DBE76B|nr:MULTISPECIES: ABC transporter permease [unclassified Thermoactinomyces]MBH8599231.1 ABC transporter permease [Thermoactinomyces sp. CICC 10523]MBH8609000.1 ABC transporter permease [Thermoactinomyces sp. CICC 10521]